MSRDYIAEFAKTFTGLREAHGTYEVHAGGSGKQGGQARTVKEPVTPDHYGRHLGGTTGLGVVPINKDNECRFGVIDVDVYNLDLNRLAKEIEDKGLPLVVCRSKSGGAHLYAFSEDWIAAEDMIKFLKGCAADLGYGKSEIFPKQKKILLEQGDVGNWINLPYFAGLSGVTTRYAVTYNADGKEPTALSLDDFLKLAEERRGDLLERRFKEEKRKDGEMDKGPFSNGPPCLIAIAEAGVPEGTRNNALFNMGVYLQKRFPENWPYKVQQYNNEHMDPPLPSREAELIIGSLQKDKDYGYKCDDQPICDFCNKDLCFTRRFGVGTANYKVDLSNLRKIESDPAVWILDVDGEPMTLDTETLFSHLKLGRAIGENLSKVVPKMKGDEWHRRLTALMDEMRKTDGAIIPAEGLSTTEGRFQYMLERYITYYRSVAKIKPDLLHFAPQYLSSEDTLYLSTEGLYTFMNRLRATTTTIEQITAYFLRREDIHKADQKDIWCIKDFVPEELEYEDEEEDHDEESPF